MTEKDKSILIRLSQDLSDRIQEWSVKTGENKSALIRQGVEFYIDHLATDKQEILELIRAIIITKLDMIQDEYQRGKMVVFTQILPIQKSLNCMICKDEQGKEYIVYQVEQKGDQSMLEAIDHYAKKLFAIWRGLSAKQDRSQFLLDLQQEHVYFSITLKEDEQE